jgi:hypothetical protein
MNLRKGIHARYIAVTQEFLSLNDWGKKIQCNTYETFYKYGKCKGKTVPVLN